MKLRLLSHTFALLAVVLAVASSAPAGPRAACAYRKMSAEATAAEAGLNYVSERGLGFTRKVREKKLKGGEIRYEVSFHDLNGRRIRDRKRLARLEGLEIPPAYTEVWISPDPRAHLQAVSRGKGGKLQYEYHPDWDEERKIAKYNRVVRFGEQLPEIRQSVNALLKMKKLTHEKVLATVTRLLDLTAIRIGGEEFKELNETYGLTTMLKKHVQVEGDEITFSFVGKGGMKNPDDPVTTVVKTRDAQAARVIRELKRIPGEELFRYRVPEGMFTINDSEVNRFIKQAGRGDFTAKDYRTWKATVVAAGTLRKLGLAADEGALQVNIATAAEAASRALTNTPTMALKSYIAQNLIELYEKGDRLFKTFRPSKGARNPPDEEFVIELLSSRKSR